MEIFSHMGTKALKSKFQTSSGYRQSLDWSVYVNQCLAQTHKFGQGILREPN
jgi:hypothetical protein